MEEPSWSVKYRLLLLPYIDIYPRERTRKKVIMQGELGSDARVVAPLGQLCPLLFSHSFLCQREKVSVDLHQVIRQPKVSSFPLHGTVYCGVYCGYR